MAEAAGSSASGGRKHLIITSGTVVWCGICGTFSETRTSRRMVNCCLGPPPAAAGNGGMRQQLISLKAGVHPVTGLTLPAPTGNSALDDGTYSRLRVTTEPTNGFVPYEPTSFVPAASSGESAANKRRLMHGRVLCKMSSDPARRRRMRRKEAKSEVNELINSFVTAANGEEVGCNLLANDQEHEAFWMDACAQPSRDHNHFRGIPTQAPRGYPGKLVRSRADALRAAMTHGKDVVIKPHG